MQKLRKQLIEWLFEVSQKVYTKYFKHKQPWNISRAELLKYSEETFGKQLGDFLHKNGYELIPKVERHDCYHVLCNYGTNVEDEIALQYLCYGNGKRSLYLFGVLVVGSALLPEYYNYYYKSYAIGKSANPFHHHDYSKLLNISLKDLRAITFSKNTIKTL
ncbi:MAG: hypothetical protein ED556_10535 [Winogradskyella sp.]|uniref:Coq4 family protein n=1 Tax=Winogradskyella sp. TaxID=1883156 RepID=UPI000F3E6212|nr:Coq4 family protein [Winogradskyella sp.]RNC84999.1 MAG: hypothetical protein ED556_10535 [Winogradskyella sp.]